MRKNIASTCIVDHIISHLHLIALQKRSASNFFLRKMSQSIENRRSYVERSINFNYFKNYSITRTFLGRILKRKIAWGLIIDTHTHTHTHTHIHIHTRP